MKDSDLFTSDQLKEFHDLIVRHIDNHQAQIAFKQVMRQLEFVQAKLKEEECHYER